MAIEITGRINFDKSSVDEATQSVKDLKKEVNKVEKVDFSSAEQSFSAFKDSADVLAGSVSSLVGGLALLGVENEYIENLEQAAVGAIAFGQGVDQAGQAVLNLSKNTKVASAAQRVFNVVANANPYLLALTAIVGVTAAFVALADALGETALEQALANQSAEELGATLRDNADAAEELGLTLENQVEVFGQAKDDALERLQATEATENSLRLQGLTEEEISQRKQEQLQSAIDFAIQQAETQRKQLEADVAQQERYQRITKTILTFLTAPIQVLLGAVDGIVAGLEVVGVISEETADRFGNLREQFTDGVTSLIFDPEQTRQEGEAAIEETENQIAELENKRDGFILRRQQKEQAEADRAAAERQKRNEEEQKLEEERQKKIEEREQKVTDFLAEQQLIRQRQGDSARQQELNSIEDDFNQQIELAGANTELLAQLEEEKRLAIKEVNDRFDEEERIQREQLQQELFLNTATEQERQLEQIENYYAQLREKAQGNAELLAQINAQEKAKIEETNSKFRAQDLEEQEQIEQQKVQNRLAAADAIINTFGAETKAGRLALIARQVIAAQQLLSEAKNTIAFSKLKVAESQAAVAAGTAKTAAVGFPQNIPLLITYAAQAAGIISAIVSAVNGANSVAGEVSGGVGGGASTAGLSVAGTTGSIIQNSGPQLFGQGGATSNVEEENVAQNNNTPTGGGSPLIRAYVSQTDLEDTNDTLDIIRSGAEL